MVTWVIEPLDVSDDAAIEAFCAARLEAEERDFAYHTAYSTAETKVAFRAPQDAVRRVVLQARDGERVIGVAAAGLPLRDNTGTVDLGVAVVPSARRRGLGGVLLAALAEQAEGRTRATAYVNWPYEAGRDGIDSPGMRFAEAHGFRVSQLGIQRVLDLPVPGATLDALETQVAPYHQGYQFRIVVGPMPPELITDYARLYAAVDVEAPTGEHVPELEVWDEARIRQEEATLAGQQRSRVAVLAFDAAGAAVGYTELLHAAADGGQVYQWGTLVDRTHRGHRLGMALKVRATRAMQDAFPDATRVRTWNAESNRPMIAVNDAIGFRPVGWEGELYRDL